MPTLAGCHTNGVAMVNAKEIHNLCKELTANFGIALIKIAAEKQISMSTIALIVDDHIKQTVLTRLAVDVFDRKAHEIGATPIDLDRALNCIRLAGESVHHLAIIHEPISDTPSPSCAAFLSRVMYPCGPEVEKTR